MYDNLENIKSDIVNAVVSNLYQIKRLKFFFGGGTPGSQMDSETMGREQPNEKT